MMRFLLNPEVRPIWGSGEESELLAAYQRVWERKGLLRDLYETWYQQIANELRPGNILEIGAGTGNFKRWLGPRRCWTLDLLRGQFVNVQADAVHLPFATGSINNIVMIDALHHLARPSAFLVEAARTLRPGGRVLLVEPFVSTWGLFVYRFLHHERVDFAFEESALAKQAWDGNAAIPQLILKQLCEKPTTLHLVSLQYCEFLAYPLSGGFSYRAFLPPPLLRGLHRLERTRCFRNKYLSLRQIAVLENAT